jgi:hypothetical protein
MSRAPKEQPRPPAPGFDMDMAALVVILEDEAEEAVEEDSPNSDKKTCVRRLKD